MKNRLKPKWLHWDKKLKNLQSELHEHRVNAVEGDPQTVDPKSQKGRQKQHDIANTAAQTDILPAGAARRYETKNWNKSKSKEPPRK